MLLRLLKNELRHSFMSNLIMMLFIAIASLLSCASISLMYSQTNQISYFMDTMGKVADLNFTMMNVSEQDKIKVENFLKEEGITRYELNDHINFSSAELKFNHQTDAYSSVCLFTTLPEKYNLVFDENNQVPEIKEGYVGIPLSMKTQYDLSVGDQLMITRGTQQETFTIQAFLRDSLYGSDMVGQKRMFLHPNDYEKQNQKVSQQEHTLVLSVYDKEGMEQLEYDMQQAGLPNYMLISKDTAWLSFLGLGIGSCSIMMMSGVILLCLSFLTIRFTILFQIESNYSEIGIMKAIGFQHAQIKPLYLMKYMGAASIGVVLGFLGSIPFVQLLHEMQAGVVPIMPTNTGTYLSILVIVGILLLVYAVTTIVLRKIKKQSAMDAIRKGNDGESYQRVSRLTLSKRSHVSIPTFLATNELIAHLRNSLMMICIYAFCLLLILIPLTLKDSFQGNAFLQILKMTDGDLYSKQNGGGSSISQLKEDQKVLLQDLQRFDPKVQVSFETMASASVSEDGLNTSAFLTKRADGHAGISFDEGKAPILKNEIALSSTLAKRYEKNVGDQIHVSCDGKEGTFLITGIYTSMMNLGNNMLAGVEYTYEYAYSSYFVINFSGTKEERANVSEQVLSEYDQFSLISPKEMLISFSGDMGKQIGTISDLMLCIVLFITVCLTILFSKMQLIKRKKEIALIQSFGNPQRSIRSWQMRRCVILSLFATILGLFLHYVFSLRILETFFLFMGMGKIELSNDFVHTYLLYPAIFIFSIVIAQAVVNRTITKWNIQNLNEE